MGNLPPKIIITIPCTYQKFLCKRASVINENLGYKQKSRYTLHFLLLFKICMSSPCNRCVSICSLRSLKLQDRYVSPFTVKLLLGQGRLITVYVSVPSKINWPSKHHTQKSYGFYRSCLPVYKMAKNLL